MRAYRLLLTGVLAGMQTIAHAQHLQWGHAITGDLAQIYAQSTAVDPSGTVIFSTGDYSGTANFDPGGSNVALTTNSVAVYLTKMSTDGSFLWARSFEGGQVQSATVAADAGGNSYLLGSFIGSVDCDPGTAVNMITASTNYRRRFLVKLDPDGNFVWGQPLGEIPMFMDGGDLCIRSNALYCTGMFIGQYDFDNGPGVHLLSAGDACDSYVLKLNTDGEFQWAIDFGATDNTVDEPETGTDIAISATGDVFVTGIFSRAGDFNPEAGISILVPDGDQDVFLMKLSADGEFQWVAQHGGELSESNARIEGSPDGSVYLCGTIAVNGNDPANEDLYVARYSGQGAALWSHTFGGPSMEQGIGIAVDEAGSVYVSGDVSSQDVDFDPGSGEAILDNADGSMHAYLLKLNASGELAWVNSFSNPINSLWGLDYINGALYGSGYFFNTIDIDMGPGETNMGGSNLFANVFIVKLDTTAIIDVTGVDELSGTAFQLYPNPAAGSVTLQLDPVTAASTATLYNLLGEIVLQQPLQSAATELDIQPLLPGIYLVEVTGNGRKSVVPLVKE